MSRLASRLLEFVVAWRLALVVVALVVAAAALWPANRLGFDRSIENMFAPDDPLLPAYQRLKQLFGGNEVVLAVYEEPDLFAPGGEALRRLGDYSRRLKQVAGVRDVLSLADIDVLLRLLGQNDGVRTDSPLARAFEEMFAGYTHGPDGRTAAVACMLVGENEPGAPPRRQTIDELRRRAAEAPGGMLAGEPVMVADGFRHVEEDGVRLGWWSTLLLAASIAVCFRSPRWVLIPVLVVQWTLLATRALLALGDLRLSMVSSMLTAIVTVVGVATVVHFIVRFRELRQGGAKARAALVGAIGQLAAPIFWSICTDIAGFWSLRVSEVGPVRDFGLMMALGSALVLWGALLLAPGLTLLIGHVDADPRAAWGERWLQAGLGRLIGAVERYPTPLALGVALLLALGVAGVTRIEVETDFTRNFRAGSPLVRSYEFIETRFGGAGVWDLIVPAPPVLTDEYLDEIRDFERRLRQLEARDDAGGAARLTKVLSLADADQAAKEYLPLRLLTPELRLRGMASVMPTFVAALWRQPASDAPSTNTPASDTPSTNTPLDGTPTTARDDAKPSGERRSSFEGQAYLRVMLRARERQDAALKLELIEQVRRACAEEDARLAPLLRRAAALRASAAPASAAPAYTPPRIEATGFYVLLTNLIHSLVRDQWLSFGAATAGVGLMMLAAFRSPSLMVIALAPNALPIFLVLGGLGWLGLKINMGAAMIAAVSMGLSVDSSIHYLTSYRRARAAGKSLSEALRQVQQSVGLAVIFSTAALTIGFSVLCFSNFVPTVYFGVLVSLSMVGGLLGNLLVLPLCLSAYEGLREWLGGMKRLPG